MVDFDDRHAQLVVRELVKAKVTPFLGAGANLCGRPRDSSWEPGVPWFPSGAELSRHLAHRFRYEGDTPDDLMAVATYGEAYYRRAELYRELRDVFDQDVPPTSLHRFLARSARLARESDSRPALIVTTNYDALLERALNDEGETYNVVAYVADGPDAGKFRHYRPDGERVLLRDPRRSQAKLPWLDEQTTILKIHGTFDPNDQELDSYVISENQYIEYLTTDIWDAIPLALIARMKDTHLLFLGYAMRDWNLMVVLKRLRLLPPSYRAWAVQLNQTPLDAKRWDERETESFDVDLNEYVDALAVKLAELD
jgi:NAD-dependent SIR2 family protein deacetylase